MNDVIQFGESHKVGDTMTSLEVAEVCGKSHSYVLKAIRKMEPAWEKITQGKFDLSEYSDPTGRSLPCYILSKRETLFVATKFKDEERAKLILRWEQLETEKQTPKSLSPVEMFALQAQINLQNEQRISNIEQKLTDLVKERQENQQLLLGAEISDEALPEETEKVKIRKLVDMYVKASGMPFKEVWEAVYATLEYRYGNRIKAYKKLPVDKSLLDVAVRNNLGQKVFNVISDMVKSYQNQ